MSSNSTISEKRRAQLRESQRRRREKLSSGSRHQVNIFLSEHAIKVLDAQCTLFNQERHEVVEKLILSLQPNSSSKS
jgi:hypothetical protein